MRRTGVTAALLALALLGLPAPARADAPAFQTVDITASDGTVLKGDLLVPTTAGPHPAVVFANSWTKGETEYRAQAKLFAKRGYITLAYAARGWGKSGGEIDTAGPKDIRDFSTVVDWLLAHTATDPAHIGAAGSSLGAGIVLIGAAHDPRVKAIVAMSDWADLVAALFGDNTRHAQAAWMLKTASQFTGRPGKDLLGTVDSFFANKDIPAVKSWAYARSEVTYLDAINRNNAPVMLANGFGDSIFPPNQVVDFYNRLTVPKRLELAPGDHTMPEASGLQGQANAVWDSTARWFDRYLLGTANGIDTENPVVLRRLGGNQAESFPSWDSVSQHTTRLQLNEIRRLDGTGPLAAASDGKTWSRAITTGVDTCANGGVAIVSNGLAALTGIPPTMWLPAIDRRYAGVWNSAPYPSGAAVRGIPALHLNLQTASAEGTVVAYLYDQDELGTSKLITHVPYTWLAPITSLDLKLQATAYDLPAGHRLALVVDTADPLYLGAGKSGSTLTFTGGSWIDVPLR